MINPLFYNDVLNMKQINKELIFCNLEYALIVEVNLFNCYNYIQR